MSRPTPHSRGVAAAGQHLLVDVASYSAWRQESDGWEPAQGAVDASPEISMSPGGLTLTPNHEGKIVLKVTGATGYIRARRAY